MDSYLRRLAECNVDTHEFKLNLKRDPKIALTCLDQATGTSEAEQSVQFPSVRRASLYDAIREMRVYESAVEADRHRKDRDGFLHNPRGG